MTSKMRDSELTLTERIDAALRRIASRDNAQFTAAELVVMNELHVQRPTVVCGA